MKGAKIGDVSLKTRIYTWISTCEKGIYEHYQMKAQWGINYQMLPINSDITQLMDYREDE